MEFKPAKCPSCGGDLQVPPDLKTAKCMYCGSDFIIEDAIKLAVAGVNLDNISNLAGIALAATNYQEAYDYYTKILEFNPDDYKAWYGKATSAVGLSTYENIRLQEAVYGFKIAIDKAPNNEIDILKKEAAAKLSNMAGSLFTLVHNHLYTLGKLKRNHNEFVEKSEIIISSLEVACNLDPCNMTYLENTAYVIQNYMKCHILHGELAALLEGKYNDAKYKLKIIEEKVSKINGTPYHLDAPPRLRFGLW